MSAKEPLCVTICNVPTDESYCEKIEMFLKPLENLYNLEVWSKHQIHLNEEPEKIIDEYLNTAQIILLLISSDFLADDFWNEKMQRVLERYKNGQVSVIPILLRPASVEDAPFSHIQRLPRNGMPVTKYENPDDALHEIISEIKEYLKELRSPSRPGSKAYLKKLRSSSRLASLAFPSTAAPQWGINGRLIFLMTIMLLFTISSFILMAGNINKMVTFDHKSLNNTTGENNHIYIYITPTLINSTPQQKTRASTIYSIPTLTPWPTPTPHNYHLTLQPTATTMSIPTPTVIATPTLLPTTTANPTPTTFFTPHLGMPHHPWPGWP